MVSGQLPAAAVQECGHPAERGCGRQPVWVDLPGAHHAGSGRQPLRYPGAGANLCECGRPAGELPDLAGVDQVRCGSSRRTGPGPFQGDGQDGHPAGCFQRHFGRRYFGVSDLLDRPLARLGQPNHSHGRLLQCEHPVSHLQHAHGNHSGSTTSSGSSPSSA